MALCTLVRFLRIGQSFGRHPDGTWKLRVTDNHTYDTGRINSWALQF